MLVILDTLATRSAAGEWQVLLDGNGKANLEKKASPVSLHLRETHAAQDSPVNSARIAYNTQAKQDPTERTQNRAEATLWRLQRKG